MDVKWKETKYWMAPELLISGQSSYKVDSNYYFIFAGEKL